jgi:hypothetical protein
MTGLAARGWLEARARGLERVVGSASDAAIALYEALGMAVTPLGPAREHWGEERRPIEIAGADDPLPFVRAAVARADHDAPAAGISRRGLLARAGGVAAGVLLVGVAEAGPACGPSAPARRIVARSSSSPAWSRPAATSP